MEQLLKDNNRIRNLPRGLIFLLCLLLSDRANAQTSEQWIKIHIKDTIVYTMVKLSEKNVFISLSATHKSAFLDRTTHLYFADTFCVFFDSSARIDTREYSDSNSVWISFQTHNGPIYGIPKLSKIRFIRDRILECLIIGITGDSTMSGPYRGYDIYFDETGLFVGIGEHQGEYVSIILTKPDHEVIKSLFRSLFIQR